MTSKRLQTGLLVGFVCYGAQLIHAFAYLNRCTFSVRLNKRFSVSSLQERSSSRLFIPSRPFQANSLPSLLFSSPTDGDVGPSTPYASKLSLKDLLSELDKRDIRYPPTASRADLEVLLQQQKSADTIKDPVRVDAKNRGVHVETSFEATPALHENETRPIQDILKELDERGIRYRPSASRDDLERLLLANASDEPKRSIQDLLKDLDERDIRYPPTASRADLEILLCDTEEARSRQQEPQDPYLKHVASRARRREKLSEQRRIPRNIERIIPAAVLETLPEKVLSTTSRAVDRAVRKARRVSRQAADLLSVDEEGVRDVDYDYVYKQEEDKVARKPIYVTAERIEKASPMKRDQRRRGKRQRPDRPPPAYSSETRTRSVGPRPTTQTPLLLPSKIETAPNPAASVSSDRPKKRSRSRDKGRPSKRRIYSPYDESISDDRDPMDRFGDFLADTTDRILFDDYDKKAPRKKGLNGAKASAAKSNTRTRHWKDRLEEQFDNILGIHEEGEYYNSWEKQTKEDRRNEGGNDAFSVAQGRKPKRHVGFGRRRKYDKPIWEEEGNLISLLFGRSSSGGSLLFERLLDQDSGSLLNLFKAFFRSFLLVGSYLSRWASVRGALPQPVVVLGLLSAALSARRRRLRAVVIALISLRTAGEIVHGYVYGYEGWEDYDDDEDAEYNERNDDT